MGRSEGLTESGPINLMVAGFALSAFVTLVAAWISIARIEAELSQVSDQQADAYVALLGMDNIVNGAVQELFAYLVSGETEELDEYRVMASRFSGEAIRFSSLAHLSDSSRKRELVILGELQEDWVRSFGQAEAMVSEFGDNKAVSAEFFHVFESTVDSATSKLDELLELQVQEDVSARSARDKIIRDSQALLVVTALASIVAIVIIGTFLTRRVAIHIAAIDASKRELELLGVAMNSTRVGFCFASASEDQPLIYVNDAMTEITGYQRSEMVGQSIRMLEGPETDGDQMSSLRDAMVEGRRIGVTIRNHRKDGEPFWNELFIAPVRNYSGELTHFVGVCNDVTERLDVESQFQRAQKLDAVGKLAGGIAHDFNNYLTVINLNAELIGRQNSDQTTGDLAKQILDAGQRSAELTRHLLAFSRRQVLTPEVLDLNHVVREMDPLLRRTLGDNISLETVTAGGLGMVTADRSRIEQVLLNLVVNARDAQPDGGRITIETGNVYLDAEYADRVTQAQVGRFVMIAVSDAGEGIAESIEDKIFDPFFTTKAVGNSGLGLSTVVGIVEQSGGFVRVYSEVGAGTTFKVYLPRVRGEAPALQVPVADVREEFEGRVLIVDDQPMVISVTVRMMQQFGFEVESGASAEEAIRLLKDSNGSLDLLLTDVVLPNMGGPELAGIVQEMYPGVPVLYMSGYTENGIIHNGQLDHGIDLLEKPFTSNDLRRKISAALARKRESGDSV